VHNEPSANPTTPRLEVPPEKFTLDQKEKQWVKGGTMRMVIINPLGKGIPKVGSVFLVPN